jgi:hypothetical protein
MILVRTVPAGPRTAAAGGRPQAGLEVVEKLLTTSIHSAWIHRSIANSVESLQASRPSEAGWRFT